jgi:hypothetical protein
MINNSRSEQDLGEASIRYWASQEQYSMQQLIEFVKDTFELSAQLQSLQQQKETQLRKQ